MTRRLTVGGCMVAVSCLVATSTVWACSGSHHTFLADGTNAVETAGATFPVDAGCANGCNSANPGHIWLDDVPYTSSPGPYNPDAPVANLGQAPQSSCTATAPDTDITNTALKLGTDTYYHGSATVPLSPPPTGVYRICADWGPSTMWDLLAVVGGGDTRGPPACNASMNQGALWFDPVGGRWWECAGTAWRPKDGAKPPICYFMNVGEKWTDPGTGKEYKCTVLDGELARHGWQPI